MTFKAFQPAAIPVPAETAARNSRQPTCTNDKD